MSYGQMLKWMSVRREQLRLLMDVVFLGMLLAVNAKFSKLWGPTTQRGFFCDDETLMYPYKENTVTPAMLHWLTLHLPLALLVILESCRCWRTKQGSSSRWQQFWPVYNTLRWFVFGHAAGSLLKNMGKQLIGRLRPHFFDVCRPLLEDGGVCSDEAHRLGGVYHTMYTCQEQLSGATAKILRDLHVSFPSGHSSMAFYGLVFMALYLQRIRWPQPASLLRPLCQLLCIGYASFVGLSRVTDYKHHWSDVVAGSLLGASVAFAAVCGAERELRLHLKSNEQEQHHPNANINTKGPGAGVVASAEVDNEVGKVEMLQLPHNLFAVTCQP